MSMNSGKENPSIYDELLGRYSKKIVIIDDDEDVIKMAQSYLLEEYPIFDYFDAHDGTTGYSLILEKIPDLIILDIKMPNLSGLEVLKQIRANTDTNISKIPVIMLTAASDSETVQTAIEQGASNYLLKPFQKTTLITRVNKILKL